MSVGKQATSVESLSSIVQFRKPQLEDGAAVWALIRDTKVLDLNSSYCYLMLTSYFRETCVIAERDDQVVGFVSGFIPPEKPETLFIWQVAVDEQARGLGVGTNMLKNILNRDSLCGVRFVETTVSPSNAASEAMFRRLARELRTELNTVGEFQPELFPGGHESERLFRIGPFTR